MYLENLVTDAVDPRRLGRFWQAALGTDTLTDEPDAFETRLQVAGGPELDLCFQPTTEPPSPSPRLHLELRGGRDQEAVVTRLLGLGATRPDTDQGPVSSVVLADPEGNPFCVLDDREGRADTGPLAALPLATADPERDASFWAELTGWTVVDATHTTLRHPSRRGPLLALRPEQAPKGPGKNRLHLDLRLEPADDPDRCAAGIVERGGRELHPPWGELPWRVFTDPSGNELCLLPVRP